MTTRRLFLDLDGVFADFNRHYVNLFGHYHDQLPVDELWGNINSVPDYFADMPVCPGAVDFFESVQHHRPMILTACPKDDYRRIAAQKKEWVRRHLPADIFVIPCSGGSTKPLFLHAPGDILIDDFARNCKAWRKAGGYAVQHDGDFGRTGLDLAVGLCA